MAAPNIVNVTTILGKMVGAELTTSNVDIVTNAVASGKVFKINSIYVANKDGLSNATASIGVYDASAATTYKLAHTITIPADATLDLISNPIYLEEGDKINALASANGDLDIIVSYEEIS